MSEGVPKSRLTSEVLANPRDIRPPEEITRYSIKLARLLRHRAQREGLEMDEAGWVSVDDLIAHLNLSYRDIELTTLHNDKSRYELYNGMIRATQGHSLEGMPVTQEALESSWAPYRGAGSIWHGTHHGVIEEIRTDGIIRGGRSHVHLASSMTNPVGKRHNVSVLIEVSQELLRAEGYEIFVSANGVVLTRHVPPSCIVGFWQTKRGMLQPL